MSEQQETPRLRGIDFQAEKENHPDEFEVAKNDELMWNEKGPSFESSHPDEDGVAMGELYHDGQDFYGWCDCPVFRNGSTCAHLFAVRMLYVGSEHEFPDPPEEGKRKANAIQSKEEAEEKAAEVAEEAGSDGLEELGNITVEQDPLEVVPSYMVDLVDDTPTINKRGYAVIANQFGIVVQAEPIVRASESSFEYAEFRALAVDSDGNEYSGFGTAHINEKGGMEETNLNEMAETRAMKRAVGWASGIGIVAWEEMVSSLSEEPEGEN